MSFNKETSRLSYSSLTRLLKEGKDSFLNPVYKKSNSLEKGTVIDKTVFKEEFTEEIMDIQIPKPQPKEIIEYIINNNLEINLASVEEASTSLDVKSKNYEKLLSTILEFPDYIEYYKNPKNKLLKINYDLGQQIGNYLLKDENVTYLFSNGKAQFEHTFQYRGFNIFIKLDYLKIDTENKEIIVTDLKSSSYPPKFPDSVKRYYYHLQGKLYLMGIEDFMEKNGYGDYTLRPFHWVVCNSLKVDEPLIYPLAYKDEIEGKVLIDDAINLIEEYILNDWTDKPTTNTEYESIFF
jgi:hypothetical protein